MSKLPIPRIESVKEIQQCFGRFPDGSDRSTVFIALDHTGNTGFKYNVIRIKNGTGEASVIGRELPLKLAQMVARRPESEDGAILPIRTERQRELEQSSGEVT